MQPKCISAFLACVRVLPKAVSTLVIVIAATITLKDDHGCRFHTETTWLGIPSKKQSVYNEMELAGQGFNDPRSLSRRRKQARSKELQTSLK
jgi:hypothetical protein